MAANDERRVVMREAVTDYFLRLFVSVAFAVPVALACGDEKTGFEPALVLVEGSTISAPSLAIADGQVSGTGVPSGLTLDDLQKISLHDVDDYPQTSANARLHLRGGSELSASAITIADDQVRIEWGCGEPLRLPVDMLRAIRTDLGNVTTEFEKSFAAPSAEHDRLFIKGEDDQLSVISGLVDSLDADQWKFEVSGQLRSAARSKVYGVVFAQPAPATSQPYCTIAFRDRSRLCGEKFSLSRQKGALWLSPSAECQFDWSHVHDVAIRSSRIAYLSELTPIREEQTPIVTLPFPAQRDKSASGGRLQVGPQFFDKGLGVHARSAITFATAGKWDTFIAKIGLDAAADGKGDCVFKILADGNSLFEKRMQANGFLAEDVRLSINGCQELTLLVEPGEGLDLADHADWCEARLIKNKRP